MAGVKKFLEFFVKVEPEQGATLSDEELAKILAEEEPSGAKPGAEPGRPASPSPAAARTVGGVQSPPRPSTPSSPGLPRGAQGRPPRVAEVAAPAVAQVRPPSPGQPPPSDLPDFETIYRAAKVPSLPHGYTIDKISAMMASPRLVGMSDSVKANSVLMALEVAGVPINDVIADAVARDRAIDDFEAWWAGKVAQVEAEKRAENAAIEEEMNRYLEAQRERIRANHAAIQQAQESFLTWKDQKRAEERRLYDNVQPFVTENPITLNTGTLGPAPSAAPGGPAPVGPVPGNPAPGTRR